MSWLVSIGQRAREAAGAVGNVGGAARAALSSVTSFADDRARRLGQAVRARVLHGRHVMMDDAVARLERAVAECEPAQRPAMLRRWLTAIRATSEPTSEPTTTTTTTTNDASADETPGVDETKGDKNESRGDGDDEDAAAAGGDADKWASLEVAAGERADAARAGAEQDSAAAGLARGAPSPVDAFGLLPSDGAAVTFRDEGGDSLQGAVEGAVEGAALTFRDVVLRSGALEALVLSYVDAPSSGDVETSLLVELLRDALMFDVRGVQGEGSVEGAEGGASLAASSLVASLAAATDAIRAQGDAEVQLGAAELRAMLAASIKSAKKIGGVEALANRERRLRRELASIARAARGGALGAGGADLAAALADLAAGQDEEDERRSGRSSSKDRGSPEEESPEVVERQQERSERSEGGGFAAPELAAATRRAVDVARTAHESAHARRVRLDAELSGSVSGSGSNAPGRSNATAEALGTLRAAAETLTRAGADADALRLESRAQLLDAQSFRDRKSSELAAAEEAVKTESDRLATRVAELRDELARTERKATDAAARAKLAAEERLEFEEAHGAVRDALQSKVSDLDRRVREYAAESAAVEAVAVCVGAVAEHRKNALKTLASDAKIDEARARGAYVASVAAHARGQAGAARLCLDR